MRRLLIVSLLLSVVTGSDVWSQNRALTAFAGKPTVKVSEGGLERLPQVLSPEQAVNLRCVISEIGGQFYWASRENKRLVRHDGGGAFLTYVAEDGAGYVRVVKPELKAAVSRLSPTEATFDYVEHVLTGLRTVTYYGVVEVAR